MPEIDSSIAVVIPARNAASTLEAAIESIQGQTLSDFQILLVDHDSDDETHRIMLEFASSDPRIEVLQHRGTFVEAANFAWEKSHACLIARMDADDVAHPARLEKQREFLLKNPDIAACATGVSILKRAADGSPLPPDDGYARYEKWVNSVVEPEQIAAERFVDSPMPNPSSMIRRSILEKHGGYADPEWAEDYDLWLRLLEAEETLGKVDEVLLNWFDGENRSTRTIARYSLDQFQRSKAFYLARMAMVQEKGVAICGAGPIGKQFALLLEERDIQIHCFYEVNQRQIGNKLRGIPVLDSAGMDHFQGKGTAIAAVGLPGARQKIRDLATASGFIEGDDFFCVA